MRPRSGISNEEYLEQSLNVFVMLLHTREHAHFIKAWQIELLTGIDTRIIADMVRAFQRQGFAIISGDGYKMARTRMEWLRHCVKERRRFKTGLANIEAAAKKYVESKELTLFEQEAAKTQTKGPI